MKHLLSLLLFFLVVPAAYAQLPQVELKDLQGNSVNTSELNNDGKPFIVSFFATWCKPCNRELSAINEVYDEWQKETGVKLIAISIDQAQNVNKVKPLVDANGWKYEVLLDPNGEVRRAVGAQMIPFVLVLDKNKNIVYKHSGYADGSENELYEKVKEACKK